MSKPRHNWWQYVCNVIDDYREHERNLEHLTPYLHTEHAAVRSALDDLHREPCGDKMLEFYDLLFWQKPGRTIAQAANAVQIDPNTAKQWKIDFSYAVAAHLGLS